MGQSENRAAHQSSACHPTTSCELDRLKYSQTRSHSRQQYLSLGVDNMNPPEDYGNESPISYLSV